MEDNLFSIERAGAVDPQERGAWSTAPYIRQYSALILCIFFMIYQAVSLVPFVPFPANGAKNVGGLGVSAQ